MKRITRRPPALILLAFLVTSTLSSRTGRTNPGGQISRRTLVKFAGLGLAALSTVAWRSRSAAARLSSGAPSAAVSCILTPEQTEGPYYIANEKVRANIVEHRPGTPLALRLTVVDAATCSPLKGATVDIWHCDASGIYSGFESASTGGGPGGANGPTDKDTFLRGIQRTGAQGRCTFQTIYPGWYRGRTVHIHVMVHVGGTVVHTGQLYFPDSLTARVYQATPYKTRAAARDTFNNGDGIYASGGAQSLLTMARTSAGGYTGTITLGVRRS